MRKVNCIEKGITLIALAITIIILLILTGVTLNTALSNNGLFKRAKQATEEYEKAGQNEIDSLNYLEGKLNEYGNKTDSGENQGNNTTKEEKKLAKELHAGDYVYYPAANGQKILCQVLYDKAYNDANKTDYGVQLIACEGIEEAEIKNMNNINSMIDSLNTKVEELRNQELTESGYTRHLGTNPDIDKKTEGAETDLNRLNELILNKKMDGTKLENCWYAWGNTAQYNKGEICSCGYGTKLGSSGLSEYRILLNRNRLFIL